MSTHGYISLTIPIQREFFDREFQNCFNTSFSYDKVHKRLQLKKNMGPHLKQSLIKLLTHTMKDPVKLQKDTDYLQDIEKRIMQILFQSIDINHKIMSPLISEKYVNIIQIYLNLHLTGEVTIQEISYDHGFYHEGHFYKKYRDMFGEKPLDTLKRNP